MYITCAISPIWLTNITWVRVLLHETYKLENDKVNSGTLAIRNISRSQQGEYQCQAYDKRNGILGMAHVYITVMCKYKRSASVIDTLDKLDKLDRHCALHIVYDSCLLFLNFVFCAFIAQTAFSSFPVNTCITSHLWSMVITKLGTNETVIFLNF